jgi:hypothetical protein
LDVFIAVIIVILLMNSFLFFVFKGIAVNVGKLAQNYVVRQLSAYDELIEKKEHTLHELNKVLGKKQAQMAKDSVQTQVNVQTSINPFAISPGNYLDTNFLPNYRLVREFFHFDHCSCINNVLQQYDTVEEDMHSSLSRQILARFSLDDRFGISTLEEQDQIELLEEILSEDEYSLLEEFRTIRKSFDCLNFFEWLETESYRSDPAVIIRTGESKENLTWLNERIKMQYDSSICEGMQIILWNSLYDFSIQKRELCG